MQMKCQKCGFDNPMGAIFCRSCGEKLDVSAISQDNKENNKPKKNFTGLIVTLVILLIIGGAVFALLYIPADKKFVPSNAKYDVSRLFPDTIDGKRVNSSLTPEQMTAYFNEKIIGEGKVQGIEHILFSGNGSDLTVNIYSKAAGCPVLVVLKGKIGKGSESQPVKFSVEDMSVGCIPLSFAKDQIAPRFALLTQIDVIRETFKAAENVEFKDGKLTFTFAKKTVKPVIKSQPKNLSTDDLFKKKSSSGSKKSKKNKK